MRLLAKVLLVFVFSAIAAIGVAQETEPLGNQAEPLYPLWEDVATSAEKTVDDPDSTNKELEELRANIVEFRTEFSQARGANADRIKTLEDQLTALGPVPENGAEPLEVATTRAELETRLEELRAPTRVADAAFRRAEGLVSEIDTIIRERQTRRLLSLGPSPLNPRNLPVVVDDLRRILDDIVRETYGLTQRIANRNMIERLPLFIILLVAGTTLMLKGNDWALKAVEYMRRFGGRGSGVWTFFVSLLRIFLPLAGLLLVTYAIRLTGVLGDIIGGLLAALPLVALAILGFRWISDRLFAANAEEALIALSDAKRRSARFYMSLLSVFFALRFVLEGLVVLEDAKPETIAFLSFPIVLAMGALVSLFGVNMRKIGRARAQEYDGEEDEEPEDTASMVRFLRVCGTGMIAIGFVAPTMAALGYTEAGNALLFPTVVSLLLLGLVLILQRFFVEVYGLISGQGAAARDGLMAVFFWTILFALTLPLFALIWGARVTDLTELWTQFLLGFEIGGTRIAPADFLAFAIIFSLGYAVTSVVQSTLRTQVLPKTRIDVGGQNAIISGVRYIGITLAALVAITVAGLDLSGLAIVAGALSVGIGFGLQTIVSNFVSGIILLIERPISEGDWIEVGGQMGYVRDISVRSTRIETFDRTDVIVPNSDLISGSVTNYTRGNTIGRLIVSVGVAYGTDTKKVDRILREIAEAQPMVMRKPPPNVLFMGFGADSLDFEIRAILRDVNWVMSVRNDINHEIAKRFGEEGIEIPFAQRDIWLRNPEALRADTGTDQ